MNGGLLGEDVRLEGEWVDELGGVDESVAEGREERAHVRRRICRLGVGGYPSGALPTNDVSVAGSVK